MAQDPFKEPWTARRIAGGAAGGGVAVMLAFAVLYNQATVSTRKVIGIVQSAGPISVAKVQGGTREAASVRLADGHVVLAYVDYGTQLTAGDSVTLSTARLTAGDAVTLLEQSHVWGPPGYEVIATNSR